MASPYLQGNFAPVLEELTATTLEIEGAVPPDLDGTLLRNGPNPAVVSDADRYHWFAGDGMLHAIDFKARTYRNRWVRTRKLASELRTPAPRGQVEPIDGPANTHIVTFAGMRLALCESGLPHLIDKTLGTVRVEDFGGALTSPMTAHPHVDPLSGAMVFFGYDLFGPPYLRYHELDASGTMVQSTDVEIPRATMQHDMAVTQDHVVFFDLPVTFDSELAARGTPMPFSWDPEGKARVGVLRRGAEGSATAWHSIDPCYVFHTMGAYEADGSIVVDLMVYESSFDTDPGGLLGSGLPHLERWTITDEGVDRTVVDDTPAEFPRIDPAMETVGYRYGYAVELLRSDTHVEDFGAILKYDRTADAVTRWEFGEYYSPGEAIFVRDADGKSDDEGWVLSVVYDKTTDKSAVWILDATKATGEAKPEAKVHLPARVPFGFHGSWVPQR